eukprot:8056-Heterococcus_DN1.PRE.1
MKPWRDAPTVPVAATAAGGNGANGSAAHEQQLQHAQQQQQQQRMATESATAEVAPVVSSHYELPAAALVGVEAAGSAVDTATTAAVGSFAGLGAAHTTEANEAAIAAAVATAESNVRSVVQQEAERVCAAAAQPGP